MSKFIFSNQYAGYLFIDVVNVFAQKHDCELLTGHYDPIHLPLNPNVRKRLYIRYRKDKTYKRIFTWLVYTIQVFFRLLFIPKHTQLVLVTNPPLVPFIGYFLHRLRGISYHLVIYDIYPDALVNFSFIRKGKTIHRLWSKWNHSLFRNANTIYTLSENMAEKIKEYNSSVQVEVIHNWSDTSLFRPIPKEENYFAVQHLQVGKLTIMYSGNMGSTHAVEKIVDMARAFKGNDSYGFFLVGEGAKKEQIQATKAAEHLDNLTILTYQPAEVFPNSIACADIGIVTLSAGAEDLSVPSKTYNLLAAGVPLLVIASPVSELARLVAHYDCGIAFTEQQVDAMIGFLRNMRENPARLAEMKKNARKASADFTSLNAAQYLMRLNTNVHV